MFEPIVERLSGAALAATHRDDGVAFLKVAKDLYRFVEIGYLCINMPLKDAAQRYSHCVYTDRAVSQFLSATPIEAGSELEDDRSSDAFDPALVMLACRGRIGEIGRLGVCVQEGVSEPDETLRRELRILGNYFHGHVLRLNGHGAEHILLSVRELDCLRWTAAGKTAWEASVILGITERTVRFHLNAAREKLNCVTTTQAVAEAVASNLIEL